MPQMALIAGAVVLLLIIGLVVAIAARPAEFQISRSAQIAAPAAAIFPLLNDFHQWVQWSPWEKLDPGMKKTFEGPAAGEGAIYSWVGNKKVGAGRMTILESMPGKRVVLRLQFFKPFAATNRTTFQLTPAAGNAPSAGTRVDWIMEGRHGFTAKAFTMFVNMDKLVGTDFERGLANLQAAVQSQP